MIINDVKLFQPINKNYMRDITLSMEISDDDIKKLGSAVANVLINNKPIERMAVVRCLSCEHEIYTLGKDFDGYKFCPFCGEEKLKNHKPFEAGGNYWW